jgi:hypothetical protein
MSSDSDSSSVVSCCDTSSISSKSSHCYSKCSVATSNSKYSINSKWSKAFNEKTLNQQQHTICTMIDGMKYNIDDARNTIQQTEQYLTIIYE